MMEKYTVLSPWAEVDIPFAKGLNRRLDTLEGKNIGMFSHFKGHSPYILREVENELRKKYQNISFSYFQYPRDTSEIRNDPDYLPKFKEWLSQVDGVIAAYGDAGSCAMYHAFNTAFVEQMGKPAVMLQKRDILSSAKRGASARHMPHLRFVLCGLRDLSFEPELDSHVIQDLIRPEVVPVIDKLIEGLTSPLSPEEEKAPEAVGNKYAAETFTGTFQEINTYFYKMGWNHGQPIVPPTREAVDEMMRGTDLSPDTVVAEIPPMLGKATVEKIAVNAVMAGCLPTHLPVLIGAVQAMVDPKVHIVGWTCSVAGFAPVFMLNGPIREAIGLNCTNNFLSPYGQANVTIPRAIALMIMNISGVRPGLEDNAYTGHEARGGVIFGENEEASPWEPYHVEAGLSREDSAITMVWAHSRDYLGSCSSAVDALKKMCSPDDKGAFDPGCTYLISPAWAKSLKEAGFSSRKDVTAYITEYARKTFGNSPVRWMADNNHAPKYVPLPLKDPSISCRKFWSADHLQVFVTGSSDTPRCAVMPGSGDHGGPACIRLQLPGAWEQLVKEYQPVKQEFVNY